jgi:hypothetical protein
MVPRQTGHVGCSSPVSGFLDDKEIIGVSPGLPVICGLECQSEFAVNESVYCFAENRYGSATLGTQRTNKGREYIPSTNGSRPTPLFHAAGATQDRPFQTDTTDSFSQALRHPLSCMRHPTRDRHGSSPRGEPARRQPGWKLCDSQDERASLTCCKCDDPWPNPWVACNMLPRILRGLVTRDLGLATKGS